MKLKIMIYMLIACIMVLCVTSCNQPVSSSQESQLEYETQNLMIDSIYDQTLPPEQNIEDNPIVDSIPLVFTDYSDFLLFGAEGELDSDKYPNAEIMIANYQLNREAFIDVKELFDLTDETSIGWSEEIVIENNNEYTYYVYSRDEFNKLKTEYRITVKYNDKQSNIAYNESIVSINSISDMLNRSGTFIYQANDFDVLYYKTETGYKSFTLINSNLSIGVFFEGDGLTQSQIAAKCGGVMSELLDGDTAMLNQTLDQMNNIVFDSNSEEK